MTMVFKVNNAKKRAQHYIDQGVAFVPGYDAFPFGNSKFAMDHIRKQEENKGKFLLNSLKACMKCKSFDVYISKRR